MLTKKQAIKSVKVPENRNAFSIVGGDKQRADQLGINYTWLIDKIDRIHAALCPDAMGTWQQRAEQAVKAAERLPAADILAFVKRCTEETQGLNWRYFRQGQTMPTPIADDAKELMRKIRGD